MVDILVLGSLNMDLVIKAPRLPEAGETIHGEDLRTIPGGKGANQAVAAARLGCRVAMVGRVGQDDFGSRLIENLNRYEVDTTRVVRDGQSPTGTALITVAEDGQNCIVISSGANGRVSTSDVDHMDELLRGARYLLLQFEIPIETVKYALESASRYGVRTILNPAPARRLAARDLEKVDILVPNEVEARMLTGIKVDDLESAGEAASELLSLGPSVVIITLGERGALLATGQDLLHVPSRKVRAVDATAAGDAFVGGLAASFIDGRSLEDAVEYANCAGALAATKLGAQTSLPTRREVQAFLESEMLAGHPQVVAF